MGRRGKLAAGTLFGISKPPSDVTVNWERCAIRTGPSGTTCAVVAEERYRLYPQLPNVCYRLRSSA
jgi:hypothetical protein